MAEKILFQTQLIELSATDKEGVGVIRRDEFGKAYRWVKNTDPWEIEYIFIRNPTFEGYVKWLQKFIIKN